MKQLFLVLLALSIFNCKEKVSTNKNDIALFVAEEVFVVLPLEVSKKDLVLNQNEGKWYLEGEPYNGYSIKRYPNGNIEERWGFYKGKREGVARRWSENGVLRVASYYHQNRLVDVYTTWWENGVLAAESHYIDGVLDGISKEWYPTGELAKERLLVNGKEDGLQRAWLQNGKLYVNYEAKNGRIFGMRRANSCYKLENEVVIKD